MKLIIETYTSLLAWSMFTIYNLMKNNLFGIDCILPTGNLAYIPAILMHAADARSTNDNNGKLPSDKHLLAQMHSKFRSHFITPAYFTGSFY